MLYEANTPEAYFEALESDWRKDKLLEVRNMILKNGAELTEGIEYKMLSYGDGKKNIFHLNAQQAYVSLYVGNLNKVENSDEMLKAFNLGKGCVRIKKSINLSDTKLNDFINAAIDISKKGGNTDC